jgi:hypothetical protein
MSLVLVAVCAAKAGDAIETSTRTVVVHPKARAGRDAHRARATASRIPGTAQNRTPPERSAGPIGADRAAPGSAANIGTPAACATAPYA